MSVLWRSPPPFPVEELNAGMRRLTLDALGASVDPASAVYWLDWEFEDDPMPADLSPLLSDAERTAMGI